ncbi:MAG: M6 family metalloprotease domain-containing protein [FCB group bacterium]|nr:M6 family metalloprotease domain-containing protein [FCB group bacterium]
MRKLLLAVTALTTITWAIPARPGLQTRTQPDGTAIMVHLMGDEWQHWTETPDGFTVGQTANGEWQYIEGYDQQNRPRFTGIRAELLPPAGLVPHQKPARSQNKPNYRERRLRADRNRTNFNIPLLLIEYPNLGHAYPQSDFDNLLNQIGYTGAHGQTGSFRDYYLENSYGAFDPLTTVYGWYMADSNYEVYGSDAPNGWNLVRQMIAAAVDAAEAAGVDWSQYDNDGDGYVDDLNIIHAGGGAEEGNGNFIWSHSWSLQDYARTYDGVIIDHYTINPELQGGSNPGLVNIGVICHEFGHALGLPDLYDTDYTSSGIGIWGLMAAGSWGGNGNSAWYPSHLSAWSKKTLGWLVPTDVTLPIEEITFPPVEHEPFVVKIAGDSPEWEYFLLENRQNFGSDTTLRSTGLLIWHIDESQWGNSEDFHYLVDLEQADGLFELNYGTSNGDPGDPFPGTFNKTQFGYETTPSSRYYNDSASGVSVVDIIDGGDTLYATVRNIPTLAFDHTEVTFDFGDGDGNFNPGESASLVFTLLNPSGTPITNLTAVLAQIPPGFSVSDTVIAFGDIDAFATADNGLQPLTVTSDSNLALGSYPLVLDITGIVDTSNFDQQLSVPLNLCLDQFGFPLAVDRDLVAAPTVADLDQDGAQDIIVAQYDGQVRVYNPDGSAKAGQWPFDAGDQIWHAPAVADIDQDGSLEIVLTSKNKHLYILHSDGGILTDVNTNQFLVANPALGDLDDDSDLEIVFGSVANDGKVYAVNPDGSAVSGFPVSIGEKVYGGAALADLDSDGYDDIVVVTKSGSIIGINSHGQIAPGFPVSIPDADFRSAPVIIRGSDGGFVILALDRSGILAAVNEHGIIRFTIDTNSTTHTSLSAIETIDGPLVLFGDDNGMVHGMTLDGNEGLGFPLVGNSQISGTPVSADFQGNGVPEFVYASTNGNIYIGKPEVSTDSTKVIPTGDYLKSSPVIADLDSDGDLEILVGGQTTLQVIDIKTSGNIIANAWSMDRGNLRRTGLLQSAMVLATIPPNSLPLAFELKAAYPNPFNLVTTIRFSLDHIDVTTLAIYDLKGREVITLWNGIGKPGNYSLSWNGRNSAGQTVATGLYFVRLMSGNRHSGQKIMLLK